MINILRGEMSLVGPRPLPCDYTPLLGMTEAKRLWVRPGLLGLAQAKGRNALPWSQRFAYDVRYATQKFEFATDSKISLTCCVLLLRGQGARMPGYTTSAKPIEIDNKNTIMS
jgi:lipopolysaccharide/colanic/teichoic acid biosynthesis glycosyltransferase